MDALRASALLLGIVFHVALSFTPYRLEVTPWAVYDPSPSHVLGSVAYVSHMFRMEVFFLIAGFFAHMVYHRQGAKSFFAIRAKRILVPFLVGWVLFYPLIVFLWVWGSIASTAGGLPLKEQVLAAWQPSVNFVLSPKRLFLERGFTLLHLWFLYYLFVLYIVTILLRKALLSIPGNSDTIRRAADRGLKAAVSSWWIVPLVAIPIAAAIYIMKDWYGVVTPERRVFPQPLIPTVSSLLVYLIFFGAGWLLHRQTDLLGCISRRWKGNTAAGLVLGTILSIAFMGYLHVDTVNELKSSVWFRWLYCYLYGIVMLLLVLGVTGFFVRYFEKPSKKWRYLADSSYWLYIIHFPIVVFFQVALYRWEVYWAFKFTLINVVSFTVMLLSYHFLVRATFIGATLNGRRLSLKIRQ